MTQLVDTNIFIEFFRGKRKAEEYLQSLGTVHCSVISAAELIQGARNKKELQTTKRFVERIEVIPLKPTIGDQMLSLMATYHLSHGLQIPDALIAATAMEENLTLTTGNIKHFSFIKNLKLLAWNQARQ
ncbi:MAG: hypothetical protein A2785_03825 [Candidatus Chisholmbacteria bacterium RIFCSPHIGHO2_01_FULL_49_18]|uniref:Ribonuclease VapC n=2 Tax=Candidatus Chisholmiibacteriota TaxID=1817900 RepID=A0A1G1VNQ6_9BACT|nr:MAG: hypothetical protein A2785_03825 [Candidatus Chisholmbacteria bacterium RIFCSPHIGHO2_01_FULL_49_18]OGY19440.1 MAG: hypothetical protein A3A65_06035 [Candidatus Chisholmbacteria bacterium RIFCSPLOWO2_01_FULL_49_14]